MPTHVRPPTYHLTLPADVLFVPTAHPVSLSRLSSAGSDIPLNNVVRSPLRTAVTYFHVVSGSWDLVSHAVPTVLLAQNCIRVSFLYQTLPLAMLSVQKNAPPSGRFNACWVGMSASQSISTV